MPKKPKDEQAQGRTDIGQVTKVVCIIAPIECYSGYRYFQLKKIACDPCPNTEYLNSPLLIIYLKTLICKIKLWLIGSTSFA